MQTLEERGCGLGRKTEQKFTVFCHPLLLPSTSPDSCRACMAFVLLVMVSGGCRIGAFRNSFDCELLGEGREFPLSPEGPWRYPGLSKHQG